MGRLWLRLRPPLRIRLLRLTAPPRNSEAQPDGETCQPDSIQRNCDETPTITSKLPKKRPSEVRSTKLPFAAVLMMSARKKQKKEKGILKKKKKKKKKKS